MGRGLRDERERQEVRIRRSSCHGQIIIVLGGLRAPACLSLSSDPILRARPDWRTLLEVADKQIDVGAGVERVAALDDHTVAAVPDEVRRGDADQGSGVDRAATERDGRAIDSLPARPRGST